MKRVACKVLFWALALPLFVALLALWLLVSPFSLVVQFAGVVEDGLCLIGEWLERKLTP